MHLVMPSLKQSRFDLRMINAPTLGVSRIDTEVTDILSLGVSDVQGCWICPVLSPEWYLASPRPDTDASDILPRLKKRGEKERLK